MDEARIAALMEAAAARAVEEKLTPLKLELARMAEREQASRLRDIIGGIGWIVGLVGIAAWFKRPT
jgi:nickel transport protein